LKALAEYKVSKCIVLMLFCCSELVSILQSRNTAVYLVSGGFRSLIEPLAEYLGISKNNIFANRLLFQDGMFSFRVLLYMQAAEMQAFLWAPRSAVVWFCWVAGVPPSAVMRYPSE